MSEPIDTEGIRARNEALRNRIIERSDIDGYDADADQASQDIDSLLGEIGRLRGAYTEDDLPLYVNCYNCMKQLCLWWNGGELDEVRCCAYVYTLEHSGGVNLVISAAKP